MGPPVKLRRRDAPDSQEDADGHVLEMPSGEPDPYYGRNTGHAPGTCTTCAIRRLAAHRGLSVEQFGERDRAIDPAAV